MFKASLISVQSESRMVRRRAGTTLAAMTGSSPSGRRTPRSCRTGRDSQQTRWGSGFHLHPTWWRTNLQIICTNSLLFWLSLIPQTKDIPKRPYSQSLATVISPALAEVKTLAFSSNYFGLIQTNTGVNYTQMGYWSYQIGFLILFVSI